MKKLSNITIWVVILFCLHLSVAKGIAPPKTVNKYGAITATTATFVNKYGAIGLYGVTSNGKEIFVVPSLATTTTVTSITNTGGTSGGNILFNGGAAITVSGVCYSTSSNPMITDGHTTNGTLTGSFSSAISSLLSATTYHVRSYATNSAGTGYGADVSFTTISCFIAGTKIIMENGGLKNIEEVKVGDRVKTANPVTGQITGQKVTTIFVHPASNDLIKLTFNNGQSSTNTKSHPYYVEGKGWCSVDPEPFKETKGINAKQLLIGDNCKLLKKGRLVAVRILKIETLPNLLVPTYNFEVNKTHCYFANGILVHNK